MCGANQTTVGRFFTARGVDGLRVLYSRQSITGPARRTRRDLSAEVRENEPVLFVRAEIEITEMAKQVHASSCRKHALISVPRDSRSPAWQPLVGLVSGVGFAPARPLRDVW